MVMKDIKLLSDHLLNDTDAECRAWSSTSFMQLYFRIGSEDFIGKVLPFLYEAIRSECDCFTIGCIITTVQELVKKKFGLSQKSLNNLDIEKIEQAKSKVIRYLDKTIKKS